MDHRSKFAVEPGAKVRLSKIDASYTGKHETHEKVLPEIQKHVERIDKLQYLLYADANQSFSSCCRRLMLPARTAPFGMC